MNEICLNKKDWERRFERKKETGDAEIWEGVCVCVCEKERARRKVGGRRKLHYRKERKKV